MLDTIQLTALFARLGTPPVGRELVLKACSAAPVRQVQSRGGNVITEMASSKMAREIRTESRQVEFVAAVDKEFDAGVLEYYAQPCELKLELVDETTGEIHKIQHFPDFLEIRENRLVIEEWKSTAKLERLGARYPWRYRKDRDGGWFAPGIEKYLSKFGIHYRIRTDKDIPSRRVENLLHLADYFIPGVEACPADVLARVRAALEEEGHLFFADLLAEPYRYKADDILKAVAAGELVVDLDREDLSQPRICRIYRDAVLRDFLAADSAMVAVPGQENFVLPIAAGTVFQYQGQPLTIIIPGEKSVVCAHADGRNITLEREWIKKAHGAGQIMLISSEGDPTVDVANFTADELKTALHRQSFLEGGDSNVLVTDRTTRRWLERQNAVLMVGGNPVLALAPRVRQRGNRTPRLSDLQLKLMDKIIAEKWRSHEARNYTTCHRFLLAACEEAGVPTPSYPTLIDRIKAQTSDRDVRSRFGKRTAYQQGAFVDVLHYDTPIHGNRPFQYVHIDHTQTDLELISGRTGKPLGRPWLSLAVDSFTRRIVGMALTFDAPSYHSVMMVIRDMVRRYGRLPEFIVTDNGKDFMSEAFHAYLNAMGTHLRFRPAGQPRHGAVLERVFGRANTEYIHNLAGNTKVTKNVRMTTGKHMPVNFAEWTLKDFYYGIEHWAFEYYDQERHPALDQSPREAFQRGLAQCGSRPQRQILFNQDFLISTCPPVDRLGVRQIDRQRGVKVNNMYYWCPEMRNPRQDRKSVPVRYDPWDASSVYVRLNDRWVQAICRTLAGLGQLTDFERRALTQEYEQKSGASLDGEKGMQRMKEFLQVFTPEGALEQALARQAENKALYDQLQCASINPVPAMKRFCLNEEDSGCTSANHAETRSSISKFVGMPDETTVMPALPFEEF